MNESGGFTQIPQEIHSMWCEVSIIHSSGYKTYKLISAAEEMKSIIWLDMQFSWFIKKLGLGFRNYHNELDWTSHYLFKRTCLYCASCLHAWCFLHGRSVLLFICGERLQPRIPCNITIYTNSDHHLHHLLFKNIKYTRDDQ